MKKNNTIGWTGKLCNLLIVFSASDPAIVNQLSGSVKYQKVVMGLLVLTTTVLATLTGGYTIYFVTQNIWVTIPGSVLYGITIFVFDYLMLALYTKKENRLEEVLQFLPRLLLAVMIGMIMAIPMSLHIFRHEVENKLKETDNIEKGVSLDSINDQFAIDTARILFEIKDLEVERNRLITQVDSLYDEMVKESGGEGKRAKGQGPIYRIYENAKKDKENRLDRVTREVEEKKVELTEREEEREKGFDKVIAELEEKGRKPRGLIDSIEALQKLPYIWFIKLFFILLETGPVVNKMLAGSSSYDELEDIEEEERINIKRHKANMAAFERNNEYRKKKQLLSDDENAFFPPFLFFNEN